MARKKHKPQRTCIACRNVKDKRELIRIARTPQGNVIIDPTGKSNGRGAYLCRQANCWKKSLENNMLGRALKITLSKEDSAALQHYLETELSKAS